MTRELSNELAAILPGWVAWAGPIAAAAVFGLAVLLVRLVVITASLRRATEEQAWTERARHVHVARMGALLSAILLPAVGILAASAFVGPFAAVPRRLVSLVLGSIGVAAAIRASAIVERYVHGPSDDGLLQSVLGMAMGFLPIVALGGLGWFAPSELTSWVMVPWIATAVTVVYAWLRAPLLMLRTPLVAKADARTSSIVERASASLSMSVDRVIELRTRQPNAFAFPWLGTVGFTSGLLGALDDDELEAITYHELAHLAESPGLTRLRQAQLYALVPIVATRPLIGTFGYAGPVFAVVAFVVVTTIVRRRGLAAEHASDAAALDAIHHLEKLGTALEKTYRLGLIPAVVPRSTHGQLHERLRAAGLEPGFEPPAPPPLGRSVGALLGVLAIVVAAWFSPWIFYAIAEEGSFGPTQLAAAMPIYGSGPFEKLAAEAEFDAEWTDAAVLYEAASVVRPNDPALRIGVVRGWAHAGECERAAVLAGQIDSSMHPQDVGFAEELVDWCALTGGLRPSS